MRARGSQKIASRTYPRQGRLCVILTYAGRDTFSIWLHVLLEDEGGMILFQRTHALLFQSSPSGAHTFRWRTPRSERTSPNDVHLAGELLPRWGLARCSAEAFGGRNRAGEKRVAGGATLLVQDPGKSPGRGREPRSLRGEENRSRSERPTFSAQIRVAVPRRPPRSNWEVQTFTRRFDAEP